ncbi:MULTISPECIES: transposase [Streptomyces]|uniref:transposase n=1 Tax=Streptomyces TaxID=1883 RepID=UPI003332D9A5
MEVPLLVADGSYGDAAAFRFGLEGRGLTTWWASPPRRSSSWKKRGQTSRPTTVAVLGRSSSIPRRARAVKKLAIAVGRQAARPVQWREGSRPGSGRSGFKRMYSRFVAPRIRPAGS